MVVVNGVANGDVIVIGRDVAAVVSLNDVVFIAIVVVNGAANGDVIVIAGVVANDERVIAAAAVV